MRKQRRNGTLLAIRSTDKNSSTAYVILINIMPNRIYAEQNPYGFYDGHFAFQREIAKYQALAKSKNPLTISIFNEKTA